MARDERPRVASSEDPANATNGPPWAPLAGQAECAPVGRMAGRAVGGAAVRRDAFAGPDAQLVYRAEPLVLQTYLADSAEHRNFGQTIKTNHYQSVPGRCMQERLTRGQGTAIR
ncbi:hypothetical protein MTO96_018310 [Rhipicephalus appendiculatus]